MFYRNYPDLAVHFDKSHFACRDHDCKARGFVAFRHKFQLDDHRYKVHGHPGNSRVIVTSKDEEDLNNELKDSIGVNMTKQVASFELKT